MPITIELSVPSHYRDSPEKRPAVILRREFETVENAYDYATGLGLKTDSDSLLDVITAAKDEYVQVEIEVLEVTGHDYTQAIISVEGRESKILKRPLCAFYTTDSEGNITNTSSVDRVEERGPDDLIESYIVVESSRGNPETRAFRPSQAYEAIEYAAKGAGWSLSVS